MKDIVFIIFIIIFSITNFYAGGRIGNVINKSSIYKPIDFAIVIYILFCNLIIGIIIGYYIKI